jgi:hypothetical protein
MDKHQEHWKGTPKWVKNERKSEIFLFLSMYYFLLIIFIGVILVIQSAQIYSPDPTVHEIANNIFWLGWGLFLMGVIGLFAWLRKIE